MTDPNKPEDGTAEGKPGDESEPGTKQTGENICPRCNGTGKLDEAPCPDCDGTGTITAIIGDT